MIQGIGPNVKIRVNPRNHKADISKISRALEQNKEEKDEILSSLLQRGVLVGQA